MSDPRLSGPTACATTHFLTKHNNITSTVALALQNSPVIMDMLHSYKTSSMSLLCEEHNDETLLMLVDLTHSK